jgi:hypothetical protein
MCFVFIWEQTATCATYSINWLVFIDSFIYPTDAQLDFSKNVNIYIKIYMKVAPTYFGFSQPPSGS